MKTICELGGISKIAQFGEIYTNKNILLVTGKDSFFASGAATVINERFVGQKVTRYSDFSVNPKISDAIAGAEIARRINADVIVAVGGGSVLDMAKLIKAFFRNAGCEERLARGLISLDNPEVPLIAIPTTAGSGSEATHFAVVYIDDEKFSLASEFLHPEAVILDGNLIRSGSKYQKTCNALDALSQAIESAWAAGSTEKSRKLAFDAISSCWRLLPKVLESGKHTGEDLQAMIIASNQAGQAINVSKTTAAHAWSYAITSKYDLPHGHAVWITLPSIFEIHANATIGQVTDKRGPKHLRDVMKKTCNILGITDFNNSKNELEKFLDILEIKYTFNDIGMKSLTERKEICSKVNAERMGNNPVDLSDSYSKIFSI